MITKRLHISSLIGCIALLWTLSSCVNDNEPDVLFENQTLSLNISTSEQVQTRTAGDNDLNENLLTSIDYYFFAENADAAVLKLHKTETGLSDVGIHNCRLTLTDQELTTLFGTIETGKQVYVYVVANMDATTRSAIENQTNTYLNSIKTQAFQTTGISKNGKQDSFVMYGGGLVTLTVDGSKKTMTGPDIRVERDAAKIDLYVTEIQDVLRIDADGNVIADDDTETEAVQQWQSVPADMMVMFYNGVNKSYIHSQINTGSHYRPDLEDPNEDCYFSLNGSNGGSRKFVVNSETGYYEHEYPFYSYLSNWSDGSGYEDYASYMILVLPWQEQNPETGENIGVPRATYYQIPTSTTDTYYENYYYQIMIKVGILGSFEEPTPVEIEAKYMIVPWGEKEVPASLREGIYLILETNKYTMNNISSASIPYITSHNITQAYVTKVEYVNTGDFTHLTKTNTSDFDGTLTVNTYVNGESFVVTTTDNRLTLNHTISPDQYTRYDVTVRIMNAAGLNDEVVFTIYPAIYADVETGGNVFVNGRFAHVQNAKGNRTGNNYPWYGQGNNWNWYTNNYNAPGYVDATYGSVRSDLGTGNVEIEEIIRIKVTSFNTGDDFYRVNDNGTTTTYTYKITDPRDQTSNVKGNLVDYLVTAQSNRSSLQYAAWDNVTGAIKTGSNSNDAIAPEFLICSGWGRTQGANAQNFTTFERRCATYQEAGYPAGRWRIPTEAEVAYIYRLQALGVIPRLFQESNSAYWASSGRAVNSYTANTLTANFTNNPNVGGAGRAGVRCVYDVWYWGEDKVDVNEYHPQPTK